MFCKNSQRLDTDNCFCKRLHLRRFSGFWIHLRTRLCFLFYFSHFESIKVRSSRSQMSFKIKVFKDFAIFTGKCLCWSLFVTKLPAYKPENLLKKDNTSIFVLIIFKNSFFLQNTFGDCLLKLCLKPVRTSPWKAKKPFTKLLWLLYWYLG